LGLVQQLRMLGQCFAKAVVVQERLRLEQLQLL